MGRTEPWGIGGTLLGGAFWRGAGACIYSQGGRGCLVGLWLVRLRVRPVRQGLAGNLKAIRNWNYAIEAQGNTQMLNHHDADGALQSRFLSPADVAFTVGMDFKKTFNKGSVSIFPGPLSYKLNYVLNTDLAEKYGIEAGKHARHDIGSKIEVNFDYKITDNISYKTRFYYFTTYTNVQADWENTLNFQVSKYISTKLFFHTRFDDFVDAYDGWGHFQFKQYLMLGLNYAW